MQPPFHDVYVTVGCGDWFVQMVDDVETDDEENPLDLVRSRSQLRPGRRSRYSSESDYEDNDDDDDDSSRSRSLSRTTEDGDHPHDAVGCKPKNKRKSSAMRSLYNLVAGKKKRTKRKKMRCNSRKKRKKRSSSKKCKKRKRRSKKTGSDPEAGNCKKLSWF